MLDSLLFDEFTPILPMSIVNTRLLAYLNGQLACATSVRSPEFTSTERAWFRRPIGGK